MRISPRCTPGADPRACVARSPTITIGPQAAWGYLRIVGMGKEALPLLMEELRREPDHWFVALQAITGNNPIAPSTRGNVEKMTGPKGNCGK